MNGQNKIKKKSKFNLNTIGLVLLVIIVTAYIYVWRNNNASQLQAAALSANITATQRQIKAVPAPASGLEPQLDTLKAKLDAAHSGFPAAVDRNEVIAYLLDTAQETQVGILPLATNGWVTENIGQAYNVLSFSATAEGNLDNVESFITAIQTGQYPTLTISGCSVDKPEAPGDEIQVTVNLKISIYTFTPPPGKDAA
jgi:hypothetical protein